MWSARKAGVRFGDIWLSAQRKCMLAAASQANKTLGLNTLSFNLLGDPVLPLVVPDQTIECGYLPELGILAGNIDNCSEGIRLLRRWSIRHRLLPMVSVIMM